MSDLLFEWGVSKAIKGQDGRVLETVLHDLAVFRDSVAGHILLPLIAEASHSQDLILRSSNRTMDPESQARGLLANGRLDILRLLCEPGLGIEESIQKELAERAKERENG